MFKIDYLKTLLFQRILVPAYSRWVRFKAEWLGMGQRDWTKEDVELIRAHWGQRHHERNYFVCDKIAQFYPASVLEIGCGCGNILYLLAKQFPLIQITGIEINPVAVRCGTEWIKEEHISNVSLQEGRAERLTSVADKNFDVVFSCAALMYVTPDHIRDVLWNMIRLSQKAVLLVEMHEETMKKYLGEFHLPNNWKRDYRKIFNEIGLNDDRIRIEPIPERLWQPGGGGATYIEVRTG